MQIQKREIKEINQQYNMMRTALSQDAPQKFIQLKKHNKTKGSSNTNLAKIGLASDDEMKNYNPDLIVKKGGDK